MKKCYSCKEVKLFSNFYRNTALKDGYQGDCKPCSDAKLRRAPSHPVNIRRQALTVLGVFCVHCGFDDIRVLQIDHINGGGFKERKALSARSIYNKVVRQETNDYQVLCINCNQIKRHVNDEFRFSTLSIDLSAVSSRMRNRRIRADALKILGDCCLYCNFSDPGALQIDHVYGGGSQDRKKKGRKQTELQIIQGDVESYQLLCANCNWIKKLSSKDEGAVYTLGESCFQT